MTAARPQDTQIADCGLRIAESQPCHRTWRAALATGLLIGGLMNLAGCDKLPWAAQARSTKPGATSSQTQKAGGTTTVQSTTVPSRPAVLPSEILATVNGVPVSQADLELRINELKVLMANVGREWKPLTSEQLEAELKAMVETELMSQEAVKRGLDRDAQTQRRFEFLRRGFFMQEWLRWNRERTEAQVSEDEVQKYYQDNKEGFKKPEIRKLREIVVTSQEQADQAMAQLFNKSVKFDDLAKQISESASASKGGLMESWVVKSGEQVLVGAEDAKQLGGVMALDANLERAVFAIGQVNGFNTPVKGPDGKLHIFQLVEMRPESKRQLSEVHDAIKSFLIIRRLQDAVDQLKSQAKIDQFPDRLSNVKQ